MNTKEEKEFEFLMDMLMEPLGELAPKKRKLLVDYKDSSGADYHQDLTTWCPHGASDLEMIQSIKEQGVALGWFITGVTEMLEDGSANCLYIAPGMIEESFSDFGRPVPANLKANIRAAVMSGAFRPVNWKELV